jgi:FtsH ternary system domain X3
MRVKVRFRYNAETGEVEAFVVDDVGTGPVADADHDARHSRAAADVARVVEQNALIEEFLADGAGAQRSAAPTSAADAAAEPAGRDEAARQRDRGLHG